MQAQDLTPKYTHVPRFEAGCRESLAYLEEHGYCVIKAVLQPEEIQKSMSLTWDFLEGYGTGIKRDDPHTWDSSRWPTTTHGDILPGHGIGHSPAQWFIRSRPAVKKVFSSIWKDDDLVTSFDGMALWRPWALNPEWRTYAHV